RRPHRRRRQGLRARAACCGRLRDRVLRRVRRVPLRLRDRRGERVRKYALLTATVLALAAPATASAGTFDPSSEFELKDRVPIHLGGLDLSINRAVVYLLVGAALTCLLGIGLMRFRIGIKPGRRQTVGELIYDIAQTQVAETGLPSKAIGLW